MKRIITLLVLALSWTCLQAQNLIPDLSSTPLEKEILQKIGGLEMTPKLLSTHSQRYQKQTNTNLKARAEKMKLDSIINDRNGPQEKWEFFFNNQGLATTVIQYHDNPAFSSGWQPWEKWEYEYDSEGRTILQTNYDYSLTFNEWVPDDRWEFAFDTMGNVILRINSSWQSSGWKFFSKREYEYNDDGELIFLFVQYYNGDTQEWIPDLKGEVNFIQDWRIGITYEWDETANEWIPTNKSEVKYINDTSISTQVLYIWNVPSQTWIPTDKYESEYHLSGLLDSSLWYKWSAMDSLWAKYYRTKYMYDSADRVIQIDYYEWDTVALDWEIVVYYIYDYDANGNRLEASRHEWDEGYQQVLPDYKYEFGYDNNQNLIEEIYSYRKHDSLALSYNTKIEYTYDLDYSRLDVLLPLPLIYTEWRMYGPDGYSLYHFNNMPLKYAESLYEDNAWGLHEEQTLFYSQIITSTSTPQPSPFTLFPNPTHDQLTIEGAQGPAQFLIYNAQGQQVLFRELSGTATLSLGHLPPGWYIYQINQDRQTYSGKILIQR